MSKTIQALSELVRDPIGRERLLDGCVAVLDREVAAKTGAVAFALKHAYKQVSKLEGGHLIRNVFDKLLDEFVEAIEPFFTEWVVLPPATRGSFRDYVAARDAAVAEALLRVTDRERDRVDNRVLVLAYNSLRGTALKLVRESVPAVAAMIAAHVSNPDHPCLDHGSAT